MAKAPKKTKNEAELPVEEKVSPVQLVSKYESDDKIRKAVVNLNAENSTYSIDFYENKKVIATESYLYHTRGYHEGVAQDYVKGLKNF